jgi:hypothetical protein
MLAAAPAAPPAAATLSLHVGGVEPKGRCDLGPTRPL